MNREFTRKELYDLVWSQPMKTVAASIGISDVALAKHCKKANIPAPTRGYWAQKQAGRPTIQVALPLRFFGACDRVGGESHSIYRYGSDWAEELRNASVPPISTFEEDLTSVEQRARILVDKLRCQRKFEPAHPLVARLLAHDEERRQQFSKWGSSYYAPKYDAGIERRRLLIINTFFLAAARLGCRPSMSTSKYGQDADSERTVTITVGQSHVHFSIEPMKTKKDDRKERLRLAFGLARDRANAEQFWEDGEDGLLEQRLTDILVAMLVAAETSYRNGVASHREWIIERKSEAEAELTRRKQEAERKARELAEKQARERIARLLAQAKALARADQIRAYVDAVRSRILEGGMMQDDFEAWSVWARQEADRIDPVKNGTIGEAIGEHARSAAGVTGG